MADSLEKRAANELSEIAKDVKRIREVLYDVGMKLTHVIERRFDYHTLPEGLEYRDGYKRSRR